MTKYTISQTRTGIFYVEHDDNLNFWVYGRDASFISVVKDFLNAHNIKDKDIIDISITTN